LATTLQMAYGFAAPAVKSVPRKSSRTEQGNNAAMNVRRFIAPDMGQALALVKKSLGEDAVILRTKKVRKGGVLSFLSRELVEVTAASPDRKPVPQSPLHDRAGEARKQLESHPALEEMRDMREELSELRGHMRELAESVRYERMPSLPLNLARRYKDMLAAGVDPKLATELTQELNIRFTGTQLEQSELVDQELAKMLAAKIPVRHPHTLNGGRTRIIALVGPTGVGKTTTMAKLVTSYRFWGKKPTALISADTYRVAALEQLKTFAAIAGLPMESVYQPVAMKNVLLRHRDKSAVFIDTAGRSQADIAKLDELAAFLDAADPDEVLLCLSVAVRLQDQLDIINRYRRLKPTGLIFTKLDESRGPGVIPSVLAESGLPASYLTVGQSVPDDVISATPKRLAALIIKPDKLAALQRTHFESWIHAERSAQKPEGEVA